MIRAGVFVACVLATPLQAEGNALNWLAAGLTFPHAINTVGTWATPGGVVLAVDPLTLYGIDAPIENLPTGAARVFGIQEQIESGRTAAMLIVWDDAEVVCGDDVATIGVDTGLAAFMLPSDVTALDTYVKGYDDLYDGPYAAQIDALTPGPFLVDLPGTSAFPLSGSGWGDGGYPVATLKDAKGHVVALYAQFITEGADWLLPPACHIPAT